MARYLSFLNGGQTLFSTSSESEKNLVDEIWGCFKYIGIPIETLKKMPTRERKYYIQMHNKQTENDNSKRNKTHNNMNLNSYAKMEQSNLQNSSR